MFPRKQFNKKFITILTFTFLVVLVSSFLVVNTSKATPGSGVTSQVIASGNLSETIWAKFKNGFKNVITDVDRIIVIKVTIAPGGYVGWHQHGGPLWVVVTEGTLTYYSGDDPSCTPINYPAGSAFMETSHHTHNARNEGNGNLVFYATAMLPTGVAVRIDAPDPGNCDF